jgi:hypothetical protein
MINRRRIWNTGNSSALKYLVILFMTLMPCSGEMTILMYSTIHASEQRGSFLHGLGRLRLSWSIISRRRVEFCSCSWRPRNDCPPDAPSIPRIPFSQISLKKAVHPSSRSEHRNKNTNTAPVCRESRKYHQVRRGEAEADVRRQDGWVGRNNKFGCT